MTRRLSPRDARNQRRVRVVRDGESERSGTLLFISDHKAKVVLYPSGKVISVRPDEVTPMPEARWTRPDGPFDVLAWCRHLDAMANRGAGAMRPEVEP